jgi:hypothetical protein
LGNYRDNHTPPMWRNGSEETVSLYLDYSSHWV